MEIVCIVEGIKSYFVRNGKGSASLNIPTRFPAGCNIKSAHNHPPTISRTILFQPSQQPSKPFQISQPPYPSFFIYLPSLQLHLPTIPPSHPYHQIKFSRTPKPLSYLPIHLSSPNHLSCASSEFLLLSRYSTDIHTEYLLTTPSYLIPTHHHD